MKRALCLIVVCMGLMLGGCATAVGTVAGAGIGAASGGDPAMGAAIGGGIGLLADILD
jgi:hypothetical protein